MDGGGGALVVEIGGVVVVCWERRRVYGRSVDCIARVSNELGVFILKMRLSAKGFSLFQSER